MKNETVESRAVTIAAKIMQAAGLCKYEDYSKCRKVHPPTPEECDKCIKAWLISKARNEMKESGT